MEATNTRLRCYAYALGGCNSPPTKEHLISRSVLTLGGNKTVFIKGHRCQQAGEVREVSVDFLVSKVLCKKHNSALSPVDTAAMHFFDQLVSAAGHLTGPAGLIPRHAGQAGVNFGEADGPLLERWLAKFLCGDWAAGGLGGQAGSPPTREPDPGLVEVAFGRRDLQAPCGLYVSGGGGLFEFDYPLQIDMTICLREGRPVGLLCESGDVHLFLNLTEDPAAIAVNRPSGAVYRPRHLTLAGEDLDGGRGLHAVSFDWGGRPAGTGLLITRKREW